MCRQSPPRSPPACSRPSPVPSAGQSLADGFVYDIAVTTSNVAGSTADTSEDEIIVAVGATTFAVDDTLTVSEDGPLASVPADGVLANDLAQPALDPARPPLTTSGAGGSLLYSNFDASQDLDNDTSWDDQQNDGTGSFDRTWTWAAKTFPGSTSAT